MRTSPLLALALCACASSTPAEKPAAAPVAAAPAPEKPAPMKTAAFVYPAAQEVDHVDEYFGVKVKDPYRWLEDPDAPASRAWIDAQNQMTFGWLGKVAAREALKARLTQLWDYERYGAPWKEGARTFYFKNDGLQNQAVLYVVDKPGAAPRVLLDPNTLSQDGTVALSTLEITDDGKLLAYAIAEGGSDWQTFRVKDVATGKDKDDVVRWAKWSSAAWTKDGKGFYYSRYPEPEKGQELEAANYWHKVYFHKLGTDQKDDVLVFEDKEHKERGFGAAVTEDGKYLVIAQWEGTDPKNRLYVQEIGKPGVTALFDKFDAAYDFVGNKGTTFFIRTDKDAPRGKVVTVDVKKGGWNELIPQGEEKLESAQMVGGGLVVQRLVNAQSAVSFYDLKGKKVRDVALPTIGTAGGFTGKSTDTTTYFSFTSFTFPTSIYEHDTKTGKTTLWKQPKVAFSPDDYEVKQVFFASKDGTKIPMFVVHKKGLVMDGDNPTYLYGYGGFNVSLTPAFSVPLVAWLERGGVYAQPTLRGGGEFGEEWHQAGMLDRKQNVFDDFQAAAQWLVDQKVTKPARLGIGGGSNGGLLVGATITQRPDLVGAAVAKVGVLDMLRYHKFTIGHAWVNEYGSSDDEKQLKTLLSYSPLHNLKAGTKYPATLITTADHDDRVVPAHSFKFAAALQKAQAGDAPVLIRIDVKAGHGAGKPTSKLIEEAADTWAFLIKALDAEQKMSAPAAATTAAK